ncbi:unnamed protein product [Heterobilharzia americana]|nr:unnamed protein product [Heterobilharzia americana]
MITFAKYVEHLEAELLKMQLHNQRLTEETCWLREELKYTQSKLEENESLLAQTEVEKKHLEFLLDLKKYDHFSPSNLGIEQNSCFESSENEPPRMVTSVLGLMSTSNHINVSNHVDRFTVHNKPPKLNVSNLSPVATCSHFQLSGIMSSSLLDTDLDSLSVNGHRKNNDSHAVNEHQNSQSIHVPPGLRTLYHIVIRYTSQGKHDVAASLCLQTIRDLEEAGGRDQAEVAALLNILALVYRDQGKIKDASDILKEVVSIREKVFGSNHVLVAAALNNLAVLHAKVGRFIEAEPLCRRALSIRENVESLFRRTLDIYAKHHKPSSPIVRKAKTNLASALMKRQKFTDAEYLLKSVLTPDRFYTSLQGGSQVNNISQSVSVEPDSAIYSISSLGSSHMSYSGYRSAPIDDVTLCDSGDQSVLIDSSERRVDPLWVILEQRLKENNGGRQFSLVTWASEARIELSVVHSAVRNLAIVYKCQGLHSHANLLLEWLQMAVTNSRVHSNHPSEVNCSPIICKQRVNDVKSPILTK